MLFKPHDPSGVSLAMQTHSSLRYSSALLRLCSNVTFPVRPAMLNLLNIVNFPIPWTSNSFTLLYFFFFFACTYQILSIVIFSFFVFIFYYSSHLLKCKLLHEGKNNSFLRNTNHKLSFTWFVVTIYTICVVWENLSQKTEQSVPELIMTPELKTGPQRIPAEKVLKNKSSQIHITTCPEHNEWESAELNYRNSMKTKGPGIIIRKHKMNV